MLETSNVIIYFDIAAVVIMLVTLASFVLRGLTHGGANRVYISCMVLVTLTALAAVAGEVYDAFIGPVFVSGGGGGGLSGPLSGSPGATASAAASATATTASTPAPPAPPGAEYPLALRNGVTIVY